MRDIADEAYRITREYGSPIIQSRADSRKMKTTTGTYVREPSDMMSASEEGYGKRT